MYRSGVRTHPILPFLFGIEGTKASRKTVRFLKETRAFGVLLLGRNIESPEQTRALTTELTQRLGRPLLFSIDHEGGWVLRFSRGIFGLPGNAALGRTRDARLAYATGRRMARELAALGIRLNLAPVMDVSTDRYNPGIGIRSFGSDPRLVGKLGSRLLRGLQEGGVCATAKHFPGKGPAAVDAHVSLPTIRLSRKALERGHIAPFRDAIKAGVDCVMTSHACFPALAPGPATFSREITTGWLRGRLGFQGVAISDDLAMGAVTGRWKVQDTARKALAAGHDLLILSGGLTAQRKAAQAVAGMDSELARAGRRLDALLTKVIGKRQMSLPASADPALFDEPARRALELIQRGVLKLPLASNGRPLLVLFPDFLELGDRFAFEGGPRGPERFVAERLRRWGPAKLLRAPLTSAKLGAIPQAVDKTSRVLFFCFEAMRFPGQRAVLDLLKRRAADRTIVCLIRNPWDRRRLSPRMTALDAHGWRHCHLNAAIDRTLARSHS